MAKNKLNFTLGIITSEFKKKIKKSLAFLSNSIKKASDSKKVKPLIKAFKKLTKVIKKSAKSVKKFAVNLSPLSKIVGVIGGAIGIFKLFQTLGESSQKFRDFDKAIREINTLISGSGGLTDSTIALIEQQSLLYGTDSRTNAEAFYQIISAGITDQKEALEVLDSGNKLAIAGVTDVKTAVDLLTSTMNVYKDSNLSAAESSDILLQAVRLGKTTIPEINASIGQTMSIAKQAGSSFEELAGAMALLTTKGVETAQSTTLLKGVFTSIFKQSDELKETIKKLELEWDTTTLKTKGLAYMMKQLLKATAGSTEVMSKFIPNIRGLAGAAILAGGELSKFVNEMRNAKGVTVEGLKDMKGAQFILNQEIEKGEFILKRIGKAIQPIVLQWTKFKNRILKVVLAVTRLVSKTKIIESFLKVLSLDNVAKAWDAAVKSIATSSNWMQRMILGTFKVMGDAAGIFFKKFIPKSLKGSLANLKKELKAVNEEIEKSKKIEKKTNDDINRKKRNDKAFSTKSLLDQQVVSQILKFKELLNSSISNVIKSVIKLKDQTEKLIKSTKEITGEKIRSLGRAFKNLTGISANEKQSTFKNFVGRIKGGSSATGLSNLSSSIEKLYSRIDENVKALEKNTKAVSETEKDLEKSKLFDERDLKVLKRELSSLIKSRSKIRGNRLSQSDEEEALRLDKAIYSLKEEIKNLSEKEGKLLKKLDILKEDKQKIKDESFVLKQSKENTLSIVQAIENQGKLITADDIAGSLQASMEGFSDRYGTLGEDLLKTLNKQQNKKVLEIKQEFNDKIKEIFHHDREMQKVFGANVDLMKNASSIFEDSVNSFSKDNIVNVTLKLKGDLNKLVEVSVEKALKNKTNNSKSFR